MTQLIRNHRFKCHHGASDFYFFYKNKYIENTVSASLYSKVIKEYNSFVRDNVSLKGNSYNIPSGLGKIEIRKKKVEITFDENGKIKNSLPVNWQETRKLWEENPEALKKRIKIRFVNEHSGGFTFKLWYLRRRATYKNKSIYRMRFNRQMKRQLSKSIFNKSIDAFTFTN